MRGVSVKMMKHMAAIVALCSPLAFAQGTISDFQWKSRLLVISGADDGLVRLVGSETAGLEERDLKVFILSGSGKKEYAANPELADEFGKRLKPTDGKPMVYLIGKDGRTTLEWALNEFSFAKLYRSIDAMPMRRREMREGK